MKFLTDTVKYVILKIKVNKKGYFQYEQNHISCQKNQKYEL